ncbi:hypothetical protein, partial [Corynebacterium freneyi]|uniref:hypothetical protein n=1 Tax=Corynebacterium freneyi TaxID=134034 RepID=UPI001E49FD6C
DGDPPTAREAEPSELAPESATSTTRPVTTPAVAPTAAKPSSFNMLRRPHIVLFCLTWPFLFLRRGYRCFPMRLTTAAAPCLTALLHRRWPVRELVVIRTTFPTQK